MKMVNWNSKEVINSIKNNGKLYDFERNLICELINGTGKIKEYTYFGQLIFELEYLNGKKME